MQDLFKVLVSHSLKNLRVTLVHFVNDLIHLLVGLGGQFQPVLAPVFWFSDPDQVAIPLQALDPAGQAGLGNVKKPGQLSLAVLGDLDRVEQAARFSGQLHVLKLSMVDLVQKHGHIAPLSDDFYNTLLLGII